MQLPYLAYVTALLQTDLFLVHLFFCESASSTQEQDKSFRGEYENGGEMYKR